MLRVRDIPEFAAICSVHAPVIVEDQARVTDTALFNYHCAGRMLHHAYLTRLEHIESTAARSNGTATPDRDTLLSRVIMTEMLVRVVAAMLAAKDRRNEVRLSETVGRNLWVTHLAIRQRALVNHKTAHSAEVADRFCRRAARWSDLLTGWMVETFGLSSYAVEPARAREFGRQEAIHDPAGHVWTMILIGIRSAFIGIPGHSRDLPPEEEDLVSAILGLFPRHCYLAEPAVESFHAGHMLHHRRLHSRAFCSDRR